MPACPVCKSLQFELAAPANILESECGQRERFIDARLGRPITSSERKDLTDFFHSGKAELRRCTTCGQLRRCELQDLPASEYSDEQYDPSVMESQYPRYVEAFRAKREPYASLLAQGSRVVEIGSHYGAFLQTAVEWGWHAEGVDIGRDTSRFARSKGFTVHQCELAACPFRATSIDGLFIWNCFEQIDDPHPLLCECARILKPDGLLVLRTPNALFYTAAQELLTNGGTTESARAFLVEALGYNNLLGFPYRYGYDAGRLERCAARHGFSPEGMINSELLTLPLPEDPAWVEREEQMVSTEVKRMAKWMLAREGTVMAPWIECWFRRQASPNCQNTSLED